MSDLGKKLEKPFVRVGSLYLGHILFTGHLDLEGGSVRALRTGGRHPGVVSEKKENTK